MKQEDIELLIKDLSARLSYKTYVKTTKGIGYVYAINISQLVELSVFNNSEYWSEVFNINEIKPYLRPMSSMTEEEYIQLVSLDGISITFGLGDKFSVIKPSVFDWLNAHHFDYRGLIERGFAVEAPEGMYNITK